MNVALLTAATQAGGAAAGPSELYPDPTIQQTGDYTFTPTTGSAILGSLLITDAGGNGTCTIGGATNTALNAALANNTAYDVALTVANWAGGTRSVRLKTGDSVDFAITGNGVFTSEVTTSTGTQNLIRYDIDDNPATLDITRISITLA